MIEVHGLTKEYIVPCKNEKKGVCLRRKYEVKTGLVDVSFSVSQGEYVGLAGLNGAGKTTLIKILSGILVPTRGEVNVLGFCPHIERKKYTPNISVVMGQKSVLFYDLPVVESIKFYAKVYGVKKDDLEERITILDSHMGIREFMHIPVRKLSLGQKMRCEIAVALLHNPKVLFLDEPTLGLDIVAKKSILELLQSINKNMGVTILLTTHDIEDISTECNRIILLSKGAISYDGPTNEICNRNRYKIIKLWTKSAFITKEIQDYIIDDNERGNEYCLKVGDGKLKRVMSYIMQQWDSVVDFSINAESLSDTLYSYFCSEESET